MSASEKRVSVYLADDHPMYREALVRAVKQRPDFELVGEAANGEQAMREIEELKPDVAVVDVRMPRLDGLKILNAVRRDGLAVRVILLTGFLDSEPAYKALAQGAGGYLSKTIDHRVLCDTIASVARGETVIGPEFQSGLVDEIRLRERDERPTLTPREHEVLRLVAEGLTVGDVGERLFVSEATVKTHLHHVYEKLGVSDRAAAVARAIRIGLIE